MDVEVLLPQRGMGMKEATIVHWHVKVGDAVNEGDKLVDVESSKASDEILAPVSGVVTRIEYQEDEEAEVGEVLAVISSGGAVQAPDTNLIAPAVPSRIDEKPPVHEAQLSQYRRVTADRMYSSLQTTAQLTLHTSVDVSETVRRREILKASSGITYTDIFIRLTANALKKHPIFCAAWQDDRLVYNLSANVGLAVDTEDGLVVPVIKNADQKSLQEIHELAARLIEKAGHNTLTTEDLSGGVFTLTNLGKTYVDHFTPILNPPETGILGIGRIRKQVIPVGDEIVVHPVLGLSLTFDHRVVDGKPAAAFLNDICAALESADF